MSKEKLQYAYQLCSDTVQLGDYSNTKIFVKLLKLAVYKIHRGIFICNSNVPMLHKAQQCYVVFRDRKISDSTGKNTHFVI